MSGGRQKGAAAALVFEMLDRALQAQHEGGPAVEIVAQLDAAAAASLGFLGEGEIRLVMRPCAIQPGDVIGMRR